MSNISKKEKTKVTVRAVRNRMILFYMIMLLAVFYAGGVFLVRHLRGVSNNSLANQTRSTALSIAAGIDCYCQNAETDVNRVFRNTAVMEFDPIRNSYPEYESNTLKNDIKDELLGLAAGRNYNDFFIIYSDSTSVGKVSYSADNDIIRSKDTDFAQILGDRYDAWIFSPSGSSRKLYYLRRVTDHSLFVMSCYIDELEPFVCAGEQNDADTVVLTNGNDGDIILTNIGISESGSRLPERCVALFNNDNETVVSDSYIGTSIRSQTGLVVYAVAENPYDLKDKTVLYGASVAFAAALVFICVLTGMIGSSKYARAELFDVSSEFTDPVTGRLNEYGLDERISELLETSLVGSTYAFIMIGIKDGAMILPTMSIGYRRDACNKMIEISESYLEGRCLYTGRIMGDRIIILADFSEFDLFKAHDELKRVCGGLAKQFEGFTADSGGALKLNVNIGVCIYPDHGEDHDSLLARAGEAFAEADEHEESCVVIYSPEKNENESKNGRGSKDGDGK